MMRLKLASACPRSLLQTRTGRHAAACGLKKGREDSKVRDQLV